MKHPHMLFRAVHILVSGELDSVEAGGRMMTAPEGRIGEVSGELDSVEAIY